MNEQSAKNALKQLAHGDRRKLGELLNWLLEHENISQRYLPKDVEEAASSAAVDTGDGGLQALLDDLTNRPDTLLVAFFPQEKASGPVFDLPGARIGPVSALLPDAPSMLKDTLQSNRPDTLAVLTRHAAQGRLGAIRNATWLQTVLGAISLAAYDHSRLIAPIALCPILGMAVFADTAAGVPDEVDRAALLARGPGSTAQLGVLLSSREAVQIILDATALTPIDLVQQRLTNAARWFQLASSASSTADAVISLGIALEILTGDAGTVGVTDKIIRRSAVFLASGAPANERGDVYFDELKRAKKLYDLRSRVAHGRYDEWRSNQSAADDLRVDFQRFVLEVALGFRRHARERNIRDDQDFSTWWKRVEIEGISA